MPHLDTPADTPADASTEASTADQRGFDAFARGVRLAGAVTPPPLRHSPVAARAMRRARRAGGG
jgi:hypothetical protein